MKNNLFNLIKDLIIIPSTKSNPQYLKQVLNQALEELKDFTVEYFEKEEMPSVLVYPQKKRPERFKVILNAHLDVVEAKPQQFKPYEKNGRLYGRGAQDMKAAAAVEILVFKNLAKKLPYPIGLQLVTDEEIGGFAGTKYQIEKGVLADFVIAGEPTDFGVNNKAKGIIWIKIKTKGKTAHGAYPWQGENALWKAKKILDRVEKFYPLPKKESWQTTFNLSKIETPNQTFNKVPDEAVISFDIRYIPEEFRGVSFAKGKKILEKKLRKIIGNLGELEIILFEPPQFTDDKNIYVKKLKEAVKKVTGRQAKTIVKHGGSDIRHFNQVGCHGVTFGPVGAGLHSDEEWVDVKSLSDYYQILEEFLKNI
jgi:succinyl-diaminopimelate desuccinylase